MQLITIQQLFTYRNILVAISECHLLVNPLNRGLFKVSADLLISFSTSQRTVLNHEHPFKPSYVTCKSKAARLRCEHIEYALPFKSVFMT